jgi:hypothetical protein
MRSKTERLKEELKKAVVGQEAMIVAPLPLF